MAVAPERRDEEFEALYRGHVRDVYRYSLSVVRDPAEAEDVTQSTFLNAYRAYTGPLGKPQAWLLTIARNICFERYRRSQRRPTLVALHEAATTPFDDASGPRAGAIFDALQGIPPRQRSALLLDAIDGRTRAEIAAELGIGETTVTGLLMRARGNLRLQLDEGMSCRLARELQPRLHGTELPDARRRAAMAHLRNCERCLAEEAPKRSIAGLFAALIPAMRSAWQPVVGALPGGTAGVGAAAAVVAAAGTIAWQAAPAPKGEAPSKTAPPALVAPAPTMHDAAPQAGFVSKRAVPARAGGETSLPASVSVPVDSTASGPIGKPLGGERLGDATDPFAAPAAMTAPSSDDPAHETSTAGGQDVDGAAPGTEPSRTEADGAIAESEPSASSADSGTDGAAPPDVRDTTTGYGNGGTPPGQAKSGTTPPGQAKKDTTPPGQANKDTTPPGQAKKDATPPGQATRAAVAEPGADDAGRSTGDGTSQNGSVNRGQGPQRRANGQADAAGQGNSGQTGASGNGNAIETGQGSAAQRSSGQSTPGQGSSSQGNAGQASPAQGSESPGNGNGAANDAAQGNPAQNTAGQSNTGEGVFGPSNPGQGSANAEAPGTRPQGSVVQADGPSTGNGNASAGQDNPGRGQSGSNPGFGPTG